MTQEHEPEGRPAPAGQREPDGHAPGQRAPEGRAPEGRGPEGRGPEGGRDPAGDEALSEAFWAVARQLRETSQETLAPWDINPSHLRALRVLTRRGVLRLSELSEHLHIAPRSTTEVVDALEARGLVQRRPDLHDRRATLVELTEHGISVLDAIRGTETGRAFGRLSPADRAHLSRILRELRAS